ncbi:M20/M25/M40 family metallo-hydrolase [Phenylobacterium sp.]|uniref:M20/M25/M40 family metallo-hydrolase n=1 Tax=Phenylobacterium sp. TaxID=1871053 RepID=UPI0027303A67|nr:M20/M25/M40 family metallo-hydrolase [Phenylobacterium sp.]MDP2213066.1 M20/M25/M40 family metallo-hydrolase [Phenylobacterium sp.]
MERTIALVACLILGAAIGWFGERGPRPAPANAPASAFSAGRALADIEIIARKPHPTGSAANFAVREHLVARMEALGLTPQVKVARPFATRERGGKTHVYGARIENLVGMLPGRDPSAPALALMAHYDSVPLSPGAGDDAAGVAAILEIIGVLRARGQPERDVIVILTDGEELGLFGARAFFAEDPLAQRIGFVINLEARGSAGRVNMFQTGANGGPTVDLFARVTPGSPSNSLAAFAYEQMPNDTDFTIPREMGLAGLNYAFAGRQFDYHSPTATVATLSRRSLQDLGDQALAATVATAYSDTLPGTGPDKVYAPLPGGKTVAYEAPLGWILIALSALLLGLAVLRARRARIEFRLLDAGQGALAGVYVLVATTVVLRFARQATGVGFGYLEQRELLAQAARFEAVVILLALGVVLLAAAALAKGGMRLTTGLLALAAGLGCQVFGGWDLPGALLGLAAGLVALAAFGQPAQRGASWTGLLATGLAGAVALQILAPTAAFLISWPLLLACFGAALSTLGAARPLALRLPMILIGAVGLGWLSFAIHALFVNLDMVELLALTAWLAAFLLWPFAHPRMGGAGRITALLVLGAGLALLALVRLDPPWSERYPRATIVQYLVDQGEDRAYRLEAAPELSDWSRRALRADGGEIRSLEATPVWRRPVHAATAPALALPSPQLELDGGAGRQVLSATPPPGASTLILELRASGPVSDVRVNGRPAGLLATPGQWSQLRWSAEAQPVQLSFQPVDDAGQLEVRYGAVTPGWPAAATPLPPRPREVMAFDTSDSTVVTGTKLLSW